MKTRFDVIEQAFRRLGMKAEDQALSGDEEAFGGATYDALMEEIGEHSYVTWDNDAIPERVFIPLANLLAVEMGQAYQIPVEPRAIPYRRLKSVMRVDDREDRAGPVYY